MTRIGVSSDVELVKRVFSLQFAHNSMTGTQHGYQSCYVVLAAKTTDFIGTRVRGLFCIVFFIRWQTSELLVGAWQSVVLFH